MGGSHCCWGTQHVMCTAGAAPALHGATCTLTQKGGQPWAKGRLQAAWRLRPRFAHGHAATAQRPSAIQGEPRRLRLANPPASDLQTHLPASGTPTCQRLDRVLTQVNLTKRMRLGVCHIQAVALQERVGRAGQDAASIHATQAGRSCHTNAHSHVRSSPVRCVLPPPWGCRPRPAAGGTPPPRSCRPPGPAHRSQSAGQQKAWGAEEEGEHGGRDQAREGSRRPNMPAVGQARRASAKLRPWLETTSSRTPLASDPNQAHRTATQAPAARRICP